MAGYNRAAAIAYAHRWAFGRNPDFGTFDELGGDCANFVSQCLYAGSQVMNMHPDGWYFVNMKRRSPSWTGVYFQHRFLVSNTGRGPFGEVCPLEKALPGDLFQMSFVDGIYTHSGLIVDVQPGAIFIAAHTIDSDNRPLNSYDYQAVRIIHILGARG